MDKNIDKPPAEPEAGKNAGKKYVLAAVTVAAFLPPFMGSAVNLAVPSIAAQLGGGSLLLGWVVSSYLLVTAALLVPAGRFSDIYGRKKVFLTGLAVFALGSLLCGLAPSIYALIAARVLQGAGASMLFSTGMAILTSAFPPRERGRVLGVNVAAVYTGLSLGPVLGGSLNHYFGWQSIFYFNFLLGTLTLLLAAVTLKGEWVGAPGERFDLLGAVMYAAGISFSLYGFSSLATQKGAGAVLAGGVLLLAAFMVYQLNCRQPVFNARLFAGNRVFAFSNLAALINYSATFAAGFLLSIYLQVVRGFDSQVAGLILLSQPVMMALLSPLAGSLSDRKEPRVISSWGMALTTAGLWLLTGLSAGTPVWWVVADLLLLGTGFAFFSSPNTNAVMSSVEKRFYGIASSTLGTMRLVGQAASMALATLIVDFFLRGAPIATSSTHLLVKSVSVSFAVFGATCFLGIFASLARGNTGREISEEG